MGKRILLAVSLVALTASASLAAPMSDGEIKSTITGKTVVLKTSYGSFPLTYGSNGRVTGDGAGTGLGKFFAPKETGTWWVKDNNMCQKFPTWYKGRVYCFKLESTGAGKLRWTRNDGYSGTGLIR